MSKHYQSLANLSTKIDFKKDFFELYSSEVELILEQADLMGYRKPKNANGSRARYYWNFLQRLQARKNK